MAELIFNMNVSLDGYVDHDHPDFMPDETLFRFFIEMTEGTRRAASMAGSLYELMQYWDGDALGQWRSEAGNVRSARVCGSLAPPAEMGGLPYADRSWPERHADQGAITRGLCGV